MSMEHDAIRASLAEQLAASQRELEQARQARTHWREKAEALAAAAKDANAHLRTALVQVASTDDKIIVDHIRRASERLFSVIGFAK